MRTGKRLQHIIFVLLPLTSQLLWAYPLDGLEESGIRRLQGYLLAQETPGGARLWPGQLWSSAGIKLHLTDYEGPDFDQ